MRQNFERILLQTPTTVLVEPSSPNGCLKLIFPREGIQNFLVRCRWGQLFDTRESTVVQGFCTILPVFVARSVRSPYPLSLAV